MTDQIETLPNAWRAAFQSSTMKVSFAIALTRPMLEMLCAIADSVRWDRSLYFRQYGQAAPDNWLASEGALIKRGLVERVRESAQNISDPESRSWVKLTPAGEAMVNLLQVTGLFVQADAALMRKARTP